MKNSLYQVYYHQILVLYTSYTHTRMHIDTREKGNEYLFH